MRIFPISDLHVNFYTEHGDHSFYSVEKMKKMFRPLGTGADTVLLACGDIGDGMCGLFWCMQMLTAFPNLQICYTPGNHEFYGSNMNTLIRQYFDIEYKCVHPRLHILDGVNTFRTIIRDNINRPVLAVIGGTLWTNYMGGNSGIMNECAHGMNDYKCITIGNENHLLRPTNCLNLHGEMSKRIFKTIDSIDKAIPVVCMSHHVPYADVATDALYWAYHSDLSEKFNALERVPKYWFHGHTHKSSLYMDTFTNGQCTFISNQYGYPTELTTGYNNECIVEV